MVAQKSDRKGQVNSIFLVSSTTVKTSTTEADVLVNSSSQQHQVMVKTTLIIFTLL